MRNRLIMTALALALLLVPASLSQDDDKPTVAVLRFGPHVSYDLIDDGFLSAMMYGGMISEAEFELLSAGADLEGEHIRLVWNDAGYNLANTSIIVEAAIDAGADVLVAYSTPLAQAATLITSEMEEPTPLIFTSVYDPFEAGIARSSCVKPAHVAGVQLLTPYEEIVPLLLLQDPDIQIIGSLHNSSDSGGIAGARRIAEVAAALGLELKEAAVAGIVEMALAAEGLVERGIEALIIPADMSTVGALPVIMQVAADSRIPVFHSVAFAYNEGATVSAGPASYATQGGMVAAILAGHLDGSLDIAKSGIGLIRDMVVGINLDAADRQGIVISDALLELADSIIHDGVSTNPAIMESFKAMGLEGETLEIVMAAISGGARGFGEGTSDVPPEVTKIIAAAFSSMSQQANIGAMLAEMRCTDEMIAEQQAELDAAEG